MRKLVLFMHLSIDGYCATPDGDLTWIPYNDNLQEWADTIVATVGSPVYGRTTYEMMKGYWNWATVQKDPAASDHDRKHTKWLEKVEKIVFSTTLKNPDWKNTTVISKNVTEEMLKLKKKPGKDLIIFGSPTLAHSLLDLGLIDEFQVTVSPVVLGRGMTAFAGLKEKVKLELLSSKTLSAGVVAHHYKVV